MIRLLLAFSFFVCTIQPMQRHRTSLEHSLPAIRRCLKELKQDPPVSNYDDFVNEIYEHIKDQSILALQTIPTGWDDDPFIRENLATIAILKTDISLLQKLIKAGCNVNHTPRERNYRLLSLAVKCDSTECVSALLEAGADLWAENKQAFRLSVSKEMDELLAQAAQTYPEQDIFSCFPCCRKKPVTVDAQ